MSKITYDRTTDRVERKFTPEWSQSGLINMDNLPRLMDSVVSQRREMVAYIEALHDELDRIIKANNLCELCNYEVSNCKSDHK